MEFKTTKEELVAIVSAYQERSFAEDISRLVDQADTVDWLVDALASHPHNGISSSEQELSARRRIFGTNEKTAKQPQSFCSLFIEALDDFILKILLVAALLSIGL